MEYNSHGKFTIWTQGDIIFAELIGSWNEESALHFEREFKKIASTMPKRWAHLSYLDDWELCVPEMIGIIERLATWSIENGLVRVANIYRYSAIKTQILNQMLATKLGHFERAVFDNDLDGTAWLSNEGFPISVKKGLFCYDSSDPS